MLEVLSVERLRELLADWQPLRALNLAGGDYRGVDLSNARLEQVDARGAQFNGAILTQSYWKDCRLDGANFSDSTADSSHMNACSLQGALFTNVRWNKAYWAQCSGEDLDLSGAQLEAFTLSECRVRRLLR